MGVEELDARAGGRPVEPGLDRSVALRDDLGDEPDPRPLLVDPAAVGGRDQPPLERIDVDPDDLDDLGAQPASDLVDLAEPADLVRGGHGSAAGPHGCAPAPRGGQVDDRARARRKRRARRLGRFQQGVAVEPIRVRVAVASLRDPDTRPAIESGRQLLDPPSSSRIEVDDRSSTKTSAKSPPLRRAAARTSSTSSRRAWRRCY